MSGKVIAFDLIGTGQTLYVKPDAHGVHFLSEFAGEVHVRIRGTPLALLAMAKSGGKSQATFSGEVEIAGDLGLGQQIQSVMAHLRVDWEELLAGSVGDIAARQLGNLGRTFSRWFSQGRTTLEMDTSEYLRMETLLLPVRDDIRQFMDAVDTLRADADRLEARIARLQRALGEGAAT
jgi:ubiquinone biosynthesis protein UbiJ